MNRIEFARRMGKLLFGLFLFALGIVVTMKANLGFGPWEVFHQGISLKVGLSIGNVSILAGLLICVLVFLAGEKLGLGTILNMVLIGFFMDRILALGIIPRMTGFLPGLLMMFAGLFIISLASYFYMGSGFGAGPRDSLMVALERKTGLAVGLCRGIVEGSAVLLGWLLGGPVGFGTVLSAFGIGFCIQVVFRSLGFDARRVQHETLEVTFRKLLPKNGG
ncbi:MAG TPA: hypothetical protein PLY83_02965 [Synergistales bacterium]|nr:hypothetical protein [Synergistales bacterium]